MRTEFYKEPTLYQVLGIDKTNDKEVIKKAYKNLALKYHPDKNLENKETAEKMFVKITNAYSILSDNLKKNEYDLELYTDISQEYNTDISQEYNTDISQEYNTDISQEYNTNINISIATDFFKIFMTNNEIYKNKNLVEKLEITLEDIYNGSNKKLKYKRMAHCINCQGHGSMKLNEEIQCTICEGLGINTVIKQMGQKLTDMNIPCEECKGFGKISKNGEICIMCNGKKKFIKNEVTNINIDRGFDKSTLIINNMGNFDNGTYSNLEIQITIKEHPFFKKKQNDLIIKHKISLCNALVDDYIIVSHLDNRKLYAKFDGLLLLNRIKFIKNEGLPLYNLPGKRGNLIIKLIIKYPEQIDASKKKYLKKILPYTENIISKDYDYDKTILYNKGNI